MIFFIALAWGLFFTPESSPAFWTLFALVPLLAAKRMLNGEHFTCKLIG